MNGETVYDVFHCNSVDVDANGNLLMSARNASAVYDVDRATGTIAWKLGGTTNNLDGTRIIKLTKYPYANLGGQHDPRFLPDGEISLFDDQSFGPGPRTRSSSTSTPRTEPRGRRSSSVRRAARTAWRPERSA